MSLYFETKPDVLLVSAPDFLSRDLLCVQSQVFPLLPCLLVRRDDASTDVRLEKVLSRHVGLSLD